MSKNRRIALIGGAGFIGHHVALRLKQLGHDVSVVDSLFINNLLSFASTEVPSSNRPLYLRMLNERVQLLHAANIPVYVQDARDYHQLNHVLKQIQPQTIVLLAAVAHADRSNKDPYSTFDHSLRTLENALDFARGEGTEHFVYFSSSMVYGNFAGGFVTEESPCDPLGVYGALKFAGEKIVASYNQVFGLPYTILRPSALYGERCVSRRVCQIFIENALEGREVTVSGEGDSRLDFTYIGDLVEGLRLVIEKPEAKNQTFNLTYGGSRSIGDLATILKSYFPNLQIRYLPKDRLTPDRGTLSVDKARQLLGYKPQFSLDKGLAEYVNWYKTFWTPQMSSSVKVAKPESPRPKESSLSV